MSKSVVVTARIEASLAIRCDEIAARLNRSRSWLVVEALECYVREEGEFLDFIQVGLDDLDSGRSIGHDDLLREIEERHGSPHAA